MTIHMDFRMPPYAKQQEVLDLSKDAEFFALFMEQRTGKSKVTIDTACYLYAKDEIDCVVIMAPNGVHRLWLEEQCPEHVWDSTPHETLLWQSGKMDTKRARKMCLDASNFKGLLFFSINIDALRTDKGRKCTEWLLRKRRCLALVDESTIIKTPGSKRTQVAIGRGKSHGLAGLADYRRILTGTPWPNKPFDIYAQMRFLQREYWDEYGSFDGFKKYFGVWEKGWLKNGRSFPELVEYRNLPELKARVDAHSIRVLRDECFDLPPQVYQKLPFELTAAQRKLYDQMRDEFIIEINGGEVTAAMAIVRMTRLQQISSNFIPDEHGTLHQISETNPRVEALLGSLEAERDYQNIIWHRFQEDGNVIEAALKKAGRRVARYDGTVSEADRAINKRRFMDGDADDFVGNPAVGARGLELYMGRNTFYYTNSFDLEHRLQSEDRTQSSHQKHSVGVIDLIASGTRDMDIVAALRAKKSIANMLTGDNLKDWI
jgi:hypothetical protein